MKSWACTRCGECCRTTPYVVVTDAERARLDAKRQGLAWEPDRSGYWRLMAGPCPLYVEGQGCSVYEVRPLNCRRFASLKGFEGSPRDARRVLQLYQRRAHADWGHAHGWHP